MPAPPPLVSGLIHDAAVFPPGNAPLDRALAEHHEHRRAWYADLVGPLLVPASGVAELVDLVGEGGELAAVVVARPSVPPEEITAALRAADGSPVTVSGVEAGWSEDWRDHPFASVPLVLEIPRGPDRDRAMTDVRDGRAEGYDVQAKFRTGATPTWPWPDEDELARFITDAVQLGIPFKLTGGLHHLVRADHAGSNGAPDPQHGLLEVLVAVDTALSDTLGVAPEDLAAILADRDGERLAQVVAGWDDGRADRVRSTFTAYGCCGVTDPIDEMIDHDLLERHGQSA